MLAAPHSAVPRCAATLRFAWAGVQELTCLLPVSSAQTLDLVDGRSTVCFAQAGRSWLSFCRPRLVIFAVGKRAVCLSVRIIAAVGAKGLVFLFFSHTRAYTEPLPTNATLALAPLTAVWSSGSRRRAGLQHVGLQQRWLAFSAKILSNGVLFELRCSHVVDFKVTTICESNPGCLLKSFAPRFTQIDLTESDLCRFHGFAA